MQDYLIAIYRLCEEQEDKSNGIKSIDIAKSLKVSKPSVSSMIKKLVDLGYVKNKPYSKIFFTKKGIVYATKLIHNHRVIEVFLKKILKMNPNEIHKEAHVLEHAFSDRVIQKLDDFLNNPVSSPHKKIIPHNPLVNKK